MSQKASLTEHEKQGRESLFGSIKNKSLLRVAILHYSFFLGSPTEQREAIKKRLWAKGTSMYNNTLAFELKPSDVTPIIHCNERAAQEYIDLLKLLMT